MSGAKIKIVMRLLHRTNHLWLVNAQVGFIMHEAEMIGYRVSPRELVLLIECLGYEAGKIQYRNLGYKRLRYQYTAIFGTLYYAFFYMNEIENYHRNLERIIYLCAFTNDERRVARLNCSYAET